MSACIFLGPTLTRVDAIGVLDAMYFPPVRQGDLYRVVSLLAPRAIGIVDGYFQWAPAVWHKEILWAMHRGVRIFGAASIGALRAAELVPYGMVGVGRIFEAYRDGVFDGEPFEDDDEVAVVHGPADSGYLAGSEAMVNIRATLAVAAALGIIGGATRARLCAIAKAAFYPERNYPAMIECGLQEGLPPTELESLERWLPDGRTNLKRADAMAMLAAIGDFLAADSPRPATAVNFERTTLWEDRVAELEQAAARDPDDADVLAELRLLPAAWDVAGERATRALVDSGPGAAPPAGTDGAQILRHAAQRARSRRLVNGIDAALVERKILALVRESGVYDELRARAKRKRARMSEFAPLPVVDEFNERQLLDLRNWYFSELLGLDLPDDIDAWSCRAGYSDLRELHAALFFEFVYRKDTPEDRT